MKLKNAPIAEVVIGAQFGQSPITYRMIFDFYQELKSSYPNIKEDKVLPAVIENPEGDPERKVLQGFHSRKFLVNSKNTKLIQIQPDRLLFNWRKTSDEQDYPHFHNVLKEFLEVYNGLKKYCELDENLNQQEVTYVDHILMEDFERSNDYNPSNILNIYNIDEKTKINSLFQFFTIPVKNLNGNMHLQLKSATRNQDNRNIISMESICRGAPSGRSLKQWYYEAHDNLIELFKNITTKNAKEKWGFTNE